MVKLHNTMSRKLEELKPQHDNQLRVYTCGPTVYDYPQLGNWATNIRWDTLMRMLQLTGYDVKWVMNITDVGHLTGENEGDADQGEDKLEKGARREGKTAWQIADFYIKDFVEGLDALNIKRPILARATDYIAEQIALVKKLEAKGYTYCIDDGIYFDTAKLSDYGKLARLKTDELRAGARVELNKQKRNITDFALWKFSPQGQKRDMEWDSPWGKGFPGWHLECSAIAMKHLDETLDIHAGGIDHIPVHHTNEIAQSETATGKPFANIWLHGNFITVDGQKLSKSLGNSHNLHDVIAKGYAPLEVRLLFLQSHYRAQANFTWEALTAAKNRLLGFHAMADMHWQPVVTSQLDETIFEQAGSDILAALQDDLNTPEALAKLSVVEQAVVSHGIRHKDQAAFVHFLEFVDNAFGLQLANRPDITAEQKTLINERDKAKAAKDFSKADELRNQLSEQGVGLRDTPHGTQWFK